jgi:hypothetical protein
MSLPVRDRSGVQSGHLPLVARSPKPGYEIRRGGFTLNLAYDLSTNYYYWQIEKCVVLQTASVILMYAATRGSFTAAPTAVLLQGPIATLVVPTA